MSAREIIIPAADGYPLGATVFEPDCDARGTVLIVPAAAVVRRIYAAYAGFLASRGFSAITWDWRGTGDSRPARLRGADMRMRDWGEKDLAGVIRWAQEHPGGSLHALGHSHGGQALGLAPNCTSLARIVTVGSQTGYWRLWPAPRRYLYALLWYLVIPGVARTLGWFPASPFRLGEDLPGGVALEWARWCRSPQYLGTWSGHRNMQAPLLSIGFSDDPFAPRAAFEWLHDRYGATEKQIRFLSPGELGVDRVGHFGFFRKDLVPSVWEETAAWFEGK